MTAEQRSDIDNGIWLCQNCATMIDRDAERYSVAMLKGWKRQAEEAADRERGQTPIAASEMALMRSALFKAPLGRSVATAVAEMARQAEQELGKVDPRFAVEVSTAEGTTQIVFRAKEPVQFSATVAHAHQTEFATKMQALVEHGVRVEMDASTVSLAGSALLDIVPQGSGTIMFDTQLRRKAVQKVLLRDPVTGTVFVMDDFVGEIVAGSQSFTFEGHAFDGLYHMRYQCEHARVREPRDQKIHFDLCCDSWRGRSVRELPYFDKLYRYFDALREGWHINLTLEVEGAELLTASSSGGIAPEALNEMRLFLRYIKCMRELLALWKLDVPFSDTPIPTTAVKQVFELWSLLCARPMLPGQRLSPGHCDVTPQNYTEATALRTSLDSAQPLAIKIGREFPEPFNLMGSYVSLSPVCLHYSQVKLQVDVPTADVKAGKSLRLAVVPMQDCVFSVEQSEPPCVLVTGPEKTIE
ncbi:hypothetical protein [Ralstonia pickettii]|uniref:hypothetical protein n=1 Tax=Ralstonia pickettii TaxID=329 RepID=UPI0015F9FCA1|nr:hypothetical protein [Ralstonia pickettii]MBB0027245.1 hypothetical protein [Ralstonia pickettii]MBB0037747.1 hypothetical protein [Ralstonia pickettii]MBB0100269.1 hypothetical protein [Ralstonia pickettii]MBB0110263.1 hypothetical protein [Ralstonia pickettii]MBB0131346.1 hypothetical protein [Ralstonia pickettii]